ncbi:MAG: hypothetical protein LBL82_06085 [Oscillospiraceae bacterium]|nr:hypothetical protein [Oscillospiraceae bacterium]
MIERFFAGVSPYSTHSMGKEEERKVRFCNLRNVKLQKEQRNDGEEVPGMRHCITLVGCLVVGRREFS